MTTKTFLSLMLLAGTMLVACSTNGEDANIEKSTNETRSAFINQFKNKYWYVGEYGLLMNDGTKHVAWDFEGIHDPSFLVMSDASQMPIFQVLSDNRVRLHMDYVFTEWGWRYEDVDYTYDEVSHRLFINKSAPYSELHIDSVATDHIVMTGKSIEERYGDFPNQKNTYYKFYQVAPDRMEELEKSSQPMCRSAL
ncbi:MAG: hypothetical protein IJV45_10370 [Prevotella sp.]|nr:hypothetical protein [Prevotella sp.]